jgi:Flp pilus assembly protein TadD
MVVSKRQVFRDPAAGVLGEAQPSAVREVRFRGALRNRFHRAAVTAALFCLAFGCASVSGQPAQANRPTNEIRIVELQGSAEISPAGAVSWVLTQTNQVLHPLDKLRVGPNSRVAIRWSAGSIISYDALAEIEILPPHDRQAEPGLHLIRGIISFFHRDTPGRIRVITRGAVAGIEGTEFVFAADEGSEFATISVLDGKVSFSNDQGSLTLTNGQQAVTRNGEAPIRTAGFIANNVLQWCFYYPAFLDLKDLPLTSDEEQSLAESIAAYRAGDLLAALAQYPASRLPSSDSERLYHAALLLSVGQVDQTEAILDALPAAAPSERVPRLASALRLLIAAVKRQPVQDSEAKAIGPPYATELLAQSYYQQSRAGSGDTSLGLALDSAKQAAAKSPGFGFAFERVAELEFSFGRTSEALEALNKSLELSPRNAQALALKGFLLAAQNRTSQAVAWFNRAIAADAALANGWLGRGLCRIRLGDSQSGREDLLVAAALEPQRALLRSYLGKAYTDAHDDQRATHELALARELDPADPTSLLYAALLKQQQNRINEAVSDLEASQELNNNRSLFRSRLLLDQDRAVSSANLASLYRDDGLLNVSVREATRAVDSDFGNSSAHLFLAESYDALRDPRQVNLRYETPWFNELLLANLLAPVGAGNLSQNISQQEYSELFQRDGLGASSVTEYTTRGDWREAGSLFGTFKRTSASFDAYYASLPGNRPNDDLDQRTFYGKIKQQFSPQDTAFLEVIQYENTSGDVRQYYDPRAASRTLRFTENQEPNLYLGWHHQWGPGSDLLFLGARLEDKISLSDSDAPFPVLARNPDGSFSFGAVLPGFGQHYDSELTAWSAELQQIWQAGAGTLIIGGRLQQGEVEASSKASRDPLHLFPPDFFGTNNPVYSFSAQSAKADLDRYTAYLYGFWDVVEPLQLSAGLTYDYLSFPDNVDLPPITSGQRDKDQLSPKAGLRWRLADNTNLRGVYTRSLGGTYYDASIRLEPSEVAGFNQAFRSAIPESIAGLVPGSSFETWGAGLDHKLTETTYLGLTVEGLNSDADRLRGAFDYFPPALPAQYHESLDYSETSFSIDLSQLIARDFVVGTTYRFLDSELKDRFPQIPRSLPTDGNFLPAQDIHARLHELDFNALWNHPSGLFAGFQPIWYLQHSSGYSPPLRDSEFWQFNASVGYRFLRRRGELRVAALNLTDRDYRLNPLNLYPELVRGRTVVLQFSFVF